jgi:hypothetical protein
MQCQVLYGPFSGQYCTVVVDGLLMSVLVDDSDVDVAVELRALADVNKSIYLYS